MGGDGSWLKIIVKNVVIFDRMLFHMIRTDDIIWSVEDSELHLTLTKREKNKLWDQLGIVFEIQRNANGKINPDTSPEPMSCCDRLEKFKQMISNDDGDHKNYEDLDKQSQEIVDTMKFYQHARATGNQQAIAKAEVDLEELGR